MYDLVNIYMPYLISALALSAAALTSVHVLLSRREPGSAIAWIGLAWLLPLLGAALYLLLGVNRIQRRAESLRRGTKPFFTIPVVTPIAPKKMRERLPENLKHLEALPRLIGRVVMRPLLPGNKLEALFDGDEVFPAMLEAIANAQHSVTLATYIFDNDKWGRRFADTLADATKRGVEVRVLIDAAGLRYSMPSIYGYLKTRGVPVRRFLPSIIPPHVMSVNLRNHRKTLVVDGRIGFTGGINIRDAHVVAEGPKFPTKDMQFRIQGPVVAHLQEVFAHDWHFSSQETLRGELWFPPLEQQAGDAIARGIPDGPDEDFDKLRWSILGALASARDRVRVITPYFVPDSTLITCLNLAAMRGVQVDIILPRKNNLIYVHWASVSLLRPLLERGCRIWYVPGPFDHSKLMIVDKGWLLLGSANWDIRSLRLNFEFNVECYDSSLATELDAYAQTRIEGAHRLTLAEHDGRPTWVKLRDGAAGLLAPYI
ncbi:MAG: cardiolipin synthase [Bradymonadaceae bacterium]